MRKSGLVRNSSAIAPPSGSRAPSWSCNPPRPRTRRPRAAERRQRQPHPKHVAHDGWAPRWLLQARALADPHGVQPTFGHPGEKRHDREDGDEAAVVDDAEREREERRGDQPEHQAERVAASPDATASDKRRPQLRARRAVRRRRSRNRASRWSATGAASRRRRPRRRRRRSVPRSNPRWTPWPRCGSMRTAGTCAAIVNT